MVKYQYTKYTEYRKIPKIYTVISILIGALFLIFCIIGANSTKNYCLKEVKVCEATITETSSENGKDYVKVNLLSNQPTEYVDPDNLWIEVDNDFQTKHDFDKRVGILMGLYDVYEEKVFGKGQYLTQTFWGIETIYDTFEQAQQENPNEKFIAPAILNKKRILKDGSTYFLLAYDKRTIPIEVDKDVFERYQVNDEVKCEFESIGDFIKLIQVI